MTPQGQSLKFSFLTGPSVTTFPICFNCRIEQCYAKHKIYSEEHYKWNIE